MSGTYEKRFTMRVEYSVHLQDPLYRAYLMQRGFCWIRPHIRKWNATLREPTVGRFVELMNYNSLCAEHVDSSAGRRLIYRLCA